MLESISREEIAEQAWLAGILDGEGTMHLASSISSRNRERTRYYIQIAVTNTDPRIIQRISEIWAKLNVKFCIGLMKRARSREYLTITSTGLGSAQKVLTFALPYLTSKKAQAQELLSFVEWRHTLGYNQIDMDAYTTYGEKVRETLHNLRYQDFNLQRLQRTASKPLALT